MNHHLLRNGTTFPVVRVSSDVDTVLFWRFLLSTPLMGILYLTTESLAPSKGGDVRETFIRCCSS